MARADVLACPLHEAWPIVRNSNDTVSFSLALWCMKRESKENGRKGSGSI
ncbi:MAG: hypothetical protein ABF785_13290 [Acetobacter papayae]